MIYVDILSFKKTKGALLSKRVICSLLVLVVATGISACGNKEQKAGQSLVRVNGEEITVLQINDELKRAGVQAEQQEAATKQLLESLIDRQLILAEALQFANDAHGFSDRYVNTFLRGTKLLHYGLR